MPGGFLGNPNQLILKSPVHGHEIVERGWNFPGISWFRCPPSFGGGGDPPPPPPLILHLGKNMCLPLLVLKGNHHYWNYFVSPGLMVGTLHPRAPGREGLC